MRYSCGGALRSSGPLPGAASPALGALRARFAFPSASAPRFLLAAICPHAISRRYPPTPLPASRFLSSQFLRRRGCDLTSCAHVRVPAFPVPALRFLCSRLPRSRARPCRSRHSCPPAASATRCPPAWTMPGTCPASCGPCTSRTTPPASPRPAGCA